MKKEVKQKEKWYQSRRMWGAILSALAAVGVFLFPEQYEAVVSLCTVLAGGLGVTSWIKPKA